MLDRYGLEQLTVFRLHFEDLLADETLNGWRAI